MRVFSADRDHPSQRIFDFSVALPFASNRPGKACVAPSLAPVDRIAQHFNQSAAVIGDRQTKGWPSARLEVTVREIGPGLRNQNLVRRSRAFGKGASNRIEPPREAGIAPKPNKLLLRRDKAGVVTVGQSNDAEAIVDDGKIGVAPIEFGQRRHRRLSMSSRPFGPSKIGLDRDRAWQQSARD